MKVEEERGAGWFRHHLFNAYVLLALNVHHLTLFPQQASKVGCQDFPGGPIDKTPCFQCRGPGSIPGQGTRSHMLQLRVRTQQLKIPSAATRTRHSQINVF